MKNINDIVFVDSLPALDLHGYIKDEATVLVNDFINENIKLKNEFISIIHGKGTGILKLHVHDILNKNGKVMEYKTYYYNDGCTIVKLKI